MNRRYLCTNVTIQNYQELEKIKIEVITEMPESYGPMKVRRLLKEQHRKFATVANSLRSKHNSPSEGERGQFVHSYIALSPKDPQHTTK